MVKTTKPTLTEEKLRMSLEPDIRNKPAEEVEARQSLSGGSSKPRSGRGGGGGSSKPDVPTASATPGLVEIKPIVSDIKNITTTKKAQRDIASGLIIGANESVTSFNRRRFANLKSKGIQIRQKMKKIIKDFGGKKLK